MSRFRYLDHPALFKIANFEQAVHESPSCSDGTGQPVSTERENVFFPLMRPVSLIVMPSDAIPPQQDRVLARRIMEDCLAIAGPRDYQAALTRS